MILYLVTTMKGTAIRIFWRQPLVDRSGISHDVYGHVYSSSTTPALHFRRSSLETASPSTSDWQCCSSVDPSVRLLARWWCHLQSQFRVCFERRERRESTRVRWKTLFLAQTATCRRRFRWRLTAERKRLSSYSAEFR